jgi:hypothetical protein
MILEAWELSRPTRNEEDMYIDPAGRSLCQFVAPGLGLMSAIEHPYSHSRTIFIFDWLARANDVNPTTLALVPFLISHIFQFVGVTPLAIFHTAYVSTDTIPLFIVRASVIQLKRLPRIFTRAQSAYLI